MSLARGPILIHTTTTNKRRELATTASLAQLDGKLDARAWDREWRLACERLDGKADAEEAQALRGRVAGLEEVGRGRGGGEVWLWLGWVVRLTGLI